MQQPSIGRMVHVRLADGTIVPGVINKVHNATAIGATCHPPEPHPAVMRLATVTLAEPEGTAPGWFWPPYVPPVAGQPRPTAAGLINGTERAPLTSAGQKPAIALAGTATGHGVLAGKPRGRLP